MKYVVWVGGTEVNDHYIDSITEATVLAIDYFIEGYRDVKIECIQT